MLRNISFIFHKKALISSFYHSLFNQYIFHKECAKNLYTHPSKMKVKPLLLLKTLFHF